MEASLFQVALARRLRQRLVVADGWCPLCGEVMDTLGDQALVCCCTRMVNSEAANLLKTKINIGLCVLTACVAAMPVL